MQFSINDESVIAALISGITTCIASLLIIVTHSWHGRWSTDTQIGAQKFHTHPTPRIGGSAIVCGLISAYYLSNKSTQVILGPMLIAGVPAFAAGLLEDFTKKVGAIPRLLATMLSGVVAWYMTGVAMQDTGIDLLDWALRFVPIAVLFTAFAVGGVANAVNIIDGFNGLAVGAVAIMLFGMGLIALKVNDTPIATISFLLASIMLGFGVVNWPSGPIFLGDGGAYLIGFMLAWIAVLLPMRHSDITAWATMMVCSYPILEVAFSYRRKSTRDGHHPGQPDKVHMHMLIYRRISRKMYPQFDRAIQNGMTSPFIWLYTIISVVWAYFFCDNDIILALGFFTMGVSYWVIYLRLTQFKWCISIRRQ